MATGRWESVLPEWRPFLDAVRARRPEQGTRCDAWTVRDVVAHNAGNAEEIARVLGAFLAGEGAPATRSFEEREPPLRALNDIDLLDALLSRLKRLVEVLTAATDAPADALVPWTGRQMKVASFSTHMRNELALHRWDLAGDDPISYRLLSQPELTYHSVNAVGHPLLRRGARSTGDHQQVSYRLRVGWGDDLLVGVGADGPLLELTPPSGDAAVDTDPAARLLLLWGRRPDDPNRLVSRAGVDALGTARQLLAGY